MSVRYDVVVKTGESRDGRAFWKKVGVIFLSETGKLKLKLEVVPLGWDGWAEIIEADQKKVENNANLGDDIPL